MTPTPTPTPARKKSSWRTSFLGSLAIAFALAGPLTEIWVPSAGAKVSQTTSAVAAVLAGTGLIKAKDDQAQ